MWGAVQGDLCCAAASMARLDGRMSTTHSRGRMRDEQRLVHARHELGSLGVAEEGEDRRRRRARDRRGARIGRAEPTERGRGDAQWAAAPC
jgi:hypothetical protein